MKKNQNLTMNRGKLIKLIFLIMNKSHNYFDFLIGTIVLLCAIGFFTYSFKSSKISTDKGYNLIAKFDNGESTFSDICQMLEYDFLDETEMKDYYVTISNDINNFSTNIVYYSPEGGVYDMGDNYLWNFNYEITDIPNVTPEVIQIMDDYLYKKDTE